MGQDHQVTIVLKLNINKYKTITRGKGILTRLIKRLITPQREENDINPKRIRRVDGRSNHIHQVYWRL